MSQIADTCWGNPTKQQLKALQQNTPYDYLLLSLFKEAPASNDSDLTRDEIKTLVNYQKEFFKLLPNEAYRYQNYHQDFAQVISKFLYLQHGLEVSGWVNQIIADLEPFVLKLKYKFQRPRPHQLAPVFKASLFPESLDNVTTPSYPSRTVFFSFLIEETLGQMFPATKQDLKTLTKDISDQRLYYGINYPSDNDFAMEAAVVILQSPEYQKLLKSM